MPKLRKSYVGDVGLVMYFNCGQVITGATGTAIKVEKPDETTTSWTATIYGTNYLKYTVQSGDFDQAGDLILQPYMTLGAWVGRGVTAVHTVYPVFSIES